MAQLTEKLIAKAHDKITRTKGREYAPNALEIQKEISYELSDQQILEGSVDYIKGCDVDTIVERSFFRAGAKWYRKQITNISDKSWEGCDGCTEQDEIMYKNGYVKGYNAAISELPKEISDEEITKLANEHILYNDSKRQWVIEGMKLYREQLNK